MRDPRLGLLTTDDLRNIQGFGALLRDEFQPQEVFDALLDAHAVLPGPVFWWHFPLAWLPRVDLFRREADIRRMLTPERLADPARRFGMLSMQEAKLDALPEIVTVYRGACALNARGWSWTPSRALAFEFADRAPDGKPLLIVGRARKADAVLLTGPFADVELIFDPDHVEIVEVQHLPPVTPDAALAETTRAILAQIDQGLDITPRIRTIIETFGPKEGRRLLDRRAAALRSYGFTKRPDQIEQTVAATIGALQDV